MSEPSRISTQTATTQPQQDRVHVPYVPSDNKTKAKLSGAIKEIPLVNSGVTIKKGEQDTPYAFVVSARSGSDAMRLVAGLRERGYRVQGLPYDERKIGIERGGYSYPKNR